MSTNNSLPKLIIIIYIIIVSWNNKKIPKKGKHVHLTYKLHYSISGSFKEHIFWRLLVNPLSLIHSKLQPFS